MSTFHIKCNQDILTKNVLFVHHFLKKSFIILQFLLHSFTENTLLYRGMLIFTV